MEDVIAPCRWRSCQKTFRSQYELVGHILAEHVEKAVPIKRKELLRKAEDAISISSNILGVPTQSRSPEHSASNEDFEIQEPITSSTVEGDKFKVPPGTPPASIPIFRPLSETASPRDTPLIQSIGVSPITAALAAGVTVGASQHRHISAPRTPSRSNPRVSTSPQVQRPAPSSQAKGSMLDSPSGAAASQESISVEPESFSQPTTTLPTMVGPSSPSTVEPGSSSVSRSATQDSEIGFSGFRSGAFQSGGHRIMLSSPPLSTLPHEDLLAASEENTYLRSDVLEEEEASYPSQIGGFTQVDLGSFAQHGGHEDPEGNPWALQTQAPYTFPTATQSELESQPDMDVVIESHSRTQTHTQGA